MAGSLKGKKVAALFTEGFEQVEFEQPRAALEAAGATVEVVSLAPGTVRGWNSTEWGTSVEVDRTVADARANDYDALLLPGGVMNPDKLRMHAQAVDLVRDFYDQGKPIAAICHAPWTLIEADIVRGQKLTSYPSLRTDLRNAGAEWTDAPVVVDRGLVTSRKPDDLPAFNDKMIEEIAEGVHGGAGRRERARRAAATAPASTKT